MVQGKKRQRIVFWLILTAAALILTVGMEVLQQSLLPPIYVNPEDVAEGTATYIHPKTGRMALVEEWSALRLLITFAIQFAVLVLLFPLKVGAKIAAAVKKTAQSIKTEITADRRKSLLGLLTFAVTFTCAFFLVRALACNALSKSNWMIDVFSVLSGAASAMLVTFRKTLGKKPEVFFLILTLMIGSLLTFFLPDSTAVSWDDGYHYQHALNYSTIGHVRFTQQDMDAMEADNKKNYHLGDERTAWLEQQDVNHAGGAVYVTNGCHLRPTEFWTGTYGLGLFLGRLFHLNFWYTWSLGRFTGLLAYALIGFFAIRRLHSGKMILACALMIPEGIFLASNFSYDPGVTILLALGLSYCFAQWQEPESRISLTDEIVILVSFLFGCLAKAIYFPILLFPMFFPRSKFADRKHHRRFILAVILTIVLLLASFMLPFLFGSGEGDTRGGSDVNTFGQALYILNHPLEYTDILLRFLGSYLGVESAKDYLGFFAYMGWAPNLLLYQLILAVVIFTDKREADQLLSSKIWQRVLMLVTLFGIVCLVATSMYVSYTPVGSGGISGCQPRYLLPVIFPAMMLLGSGKIRNHMNQALYNGIVFAGVGYVGFCAALFTCIAKYA